MVNFTGIIKAQRKWSHDNKPEYINTNTIKIMTPYPCIGTDITFIDQRCTTYNYSPEIRAKAILEADKTGQIVDIDEFAKSEENKLDIEG